MRSLGFIWQFIVLGALVVLLAACGGGDINIDASSVDNSVDNSTSGGGGGTGDNICASYVDADGNTQAGVLQDGNCLYTTAFVDFRKPLLADITLRDIGAGAHIFTGSLFVGQNYDSLAAARAAGLNRGGDGPTLTIEAGVTVALAGAGDFIAIMRGSQILAEGTRDDPITFTSRADVEGRFAMAPEEVQSWGGMVINGFGFNNRCEYAASQDSSPTLEGDCSIVMEGAEDLRENHYGGDLPGDNSGTLRYVVVKHAGDFISEGNELNGITFGAVGSGTTLNNIQIYSNQDDGIEFFGGSADLTNYVALYVRDDSIDLDEGYNGTISNALVIQGGGTGEATKTGAHCVESDGSGRNRLAFNISNDYVTQATINNLTCISSAKGPGVAGNSDPGAGVNLEEGHKLTLNRSIVTTAYATDATANGAGVGIAAENLDFTNYCFQMEDSQDWENAARGEIKISTNIFACHDLSANRDRDSDVTLPTGTPPEDYPFGGLSGRRFLAHPDRDNVIFAMAEGAEDAGSTRPDGDGSQADQMTILDGFYSVPLASMMVDGEAVSDTITVADGEIIGAVSKDNDWTRGWTYGLHEGARGQELWFEE
ncbi:MAG: serine/threonine protein kinase [Cellvibrionales bacterium]|nr:serine/threonine protein kinase [Cellvibrionales bacterium]